MQELDIYPKMCTRYPQSIQLGLRISVKECLNFHFLTNITQIVSQPYQYRFRPLIIISFTDNGIIFVLHQGVDLKV